MTATRQPKLAATSPVMPPASEAPRHQVERVTLMTRPRNRAGQVSASVGVVAILLAASSNNLLKATYAVARNGARMFATLDLAMSLCSGVTLAVGLRNANDQSFQLGFCAGSRVFCCDYADLPIMWSDSGKARQKRSSIPGSSLSNEACNCRIPLIYPGTLPTYPLSFAKSTCQSC